MDRSQPGQIVPRDPLKKPFTKTGLEEWLKVKALSSSPSTGGKKKAHSSTYYFPLFN
jgi:hypothetical protein